jgi:hypothetical protein
LAAAREIRDADDQAEALAGLAPRLAELGHLQEALAVARGIGIENERWRAEALARLTPHLPQVLPREALAAAREIRDTDDQAEALAGLALQLAELGHLQQALTVARGIGEEWCRPETLADLAPYLAELAPTTLCSLWCETLPVLSTRTRTDLLADLCALAPVVAALGGAQAMAETFRAIQDVGRWWP